MTARSVHHLELTPVVGSRFQPTGFPDLGAATFERADSPGEQLLVESVQSMANHLEGLTWDVAAQRPTEAVADLPYVRVVADNGDFLTSSRLEAHRLAASWLMDSADGSTEFRASLRDRFGLAAAGRPIDYRLIAQQIFALDPLSLLHGVFFAQPSWAWQPRIARAVTCFIEAADVHPAISGGVKKDSVVNTTKDGAAVGRTSKEGYGMVPHHRTEYTAGSITLYHVVDEQQLRAFGLSQSATELLSALAAWELAALLEDGLRLRTACDLVPADSSEVPSAADARTRLAAAVDACTSAGEIGDVTELVNTVKPKSPKA
jgi:CRISPR-associated protein Csb1